MPRATRLFVLFDRHGSLAFAFDFRNGCHDAANSIATVASTGVLRPHYAVVWVTLFNFVAISSST